MAYRKRDLECEAPSQIKGFLQLVLLSRIDTRDVAEKILQGLLPRLYSLCNRAPESIDHILISCPFVSPIWSLFCNAAGIPLFLHLHPNSLSSSHHGVTSLSPCNLLAQKLDFISCCKERLKVWLVHTMKWKGTAGLLLNWLESCRNSPSDVSLMHDYEAMVMSWVTRWDQLFTLRLFCHVIFITANWKDPSITSPLLNLSVSLLLQTPLWPLSTCNSFIFSINNG